MPKKISKAAASDDVALKSLALKHWPHTLKCDVVSLEFPIFTLMAGGDDKVRTFEDSRTKSRIEIHPSTKGSASILDQEILMYLFTLLVKESDAGSPIASDFTFKALDLLKALNRGSSGSDYRDLNDALDRLVGTRIKTNIRTGGQIELQNFSLLQSCLIVQTEKGVMQHITVSVSQWFFRSISCGDFIGLPRSYFDLSSPTEKRLYQIVRKHCGQQSKFKIGLPRLYEKSGSDSTESLFKCRLKKYVGGDHKELLNYYLAIRKDILYAFPNSARGRAELGKFHLLPIIEKKVSSAA